MNEVIGLVLITAPAAIFFIAGVLYTLWFEWWKHIQGWSQFGLISAITILFSTNSFVGFSYVLTGSVAAWWGFVEIFIWLLISSAGVMLWVALAKSREKEETTQPKKVLQNGSR